MRKIVLGEDIAVLSNLHIAMPAIPTAITAVSFDIVNFGGGSSFIEISSQKFTKSNRKFNQMERVKSPSKLYQTGNVADLVKNRRGLAGKVENNAYLTDPGRVLPIEADELIWNRMVIDVWDDEDRKWEAIG